MVWAWRKGFAAHVQQSAWLIVYCVVKVEVGSGENDGSVNGAMRMLAPVWPPMEVAMATRDGLIDTAVIGLCNGVVT